MPAVPLDAAARQAILHATCGDAIYDFYEMAVCADEAAWVVVVAFVVKQIVIPPDLQRQPCRLIR